MNQQVYQDLNGRIVCFDHLGSYAKAAFTASPRSRRQETPITVWERLSKKDIAEIENIMRQDYALDGYSVMCEDCAHQALVGNRNSKEASK